jgi:hypothetical protein
MNQDPEKSEQETKGNEESKPALKSKSGFESVVKTFIRDVETIRYASMLINGFVYKKSFEEINSKMDFVKFPDAESVRSDDYELTVNSESVYDLRRTVDDISKAANILRLAPRTFLNLLISQYDAFIGNLVNQIILTKPDVLLASDRAITLAQLSEFDTVEEAKSFFLEKQVEDVVRQSHSDHFDWFEKRLNVELRKGLDIWPEFIEMTERRNLFAHTDGRISRQYLLITKRNGYCPETELKLGDQLYIDESYIDRACDVLLELGIKLTHVAWRKIDSKASKRADMVLIDNTFNLNRESRFGVTSKVLAFALDSPIGAKMEERDRLICLVNLAVAKRELGEGAEVKKILDAVDWSAKSEEFRFANVVLKSDWKACAVIMKSMGSNSYLGKEEYRTWPLFNEFRLTEEFQKTFSEVFGIRYVEYEQICAKRRVFQMNEQIRKGQDLDPSDHDGA